MVDSQATKNTCNASVESKGFCSYKATNGIKRHLAIDSLGFPFFTHCTKASVSDNQGLIEMFEQNIAYFKSKPVNIPKITVMVEHGYNPLYLTKQLETIYSQIMTKIRFKLAPKLSKQEKKAQGEYGFMVIPMRWIVERSNAWVERCQSLVKNFDRTLANANTRLKMCSVRLMLKRLAKPS
ncbi:transposase [Pseudanabaena sp. FACHB-723]|uniref:Transposase n=1 Tax=Pseudanabaena mucicola FACHB-723 TaxID=2692860 RepID=A0ABR8A0Y2_9CYAN|nr:transposase [Pseudanabaena mucicola FACHB-723]